MDWNDITSTLTTDLDKLPTEFHVARFCARPVLSTADETYIRALIERGINWTLFVRIARQQRIVPLVYRSLSRLSPPGLPGSVLRTLYADVQHNVKRNLLLITELVRLFRLFQAENIRALAFKGPTLAMAAYGQLSLRHAGDLDILVPHQHFARATELLRLQGYARALDKGGALERWGEAKYKRHNHSFNFIHEGKQTVIDLHWRLASQHHGFPIPMDDIWNRPKSLDVLNTTVQTLREEELLLYLCFHGSKHGWIRVSWVCDLAILMRRHEGLDWHHILGQAETLSSQRSLCVGLVLAHVLFGSILPEPIQQYTRRDRIVPHLVQKTLRFLLKTSCTSADSTTSPDLYQVPYSFWLRPSISQKVRLLLAYFSPKLSDYVWLPLPKTFFPVYYSFPNLVVDSPNTS